VDAVLLADGLESGPLLWHQLLIFEHLAAIFPKPLMIPAPPDLSSGELKALWDAGVDGIMVAAEGTKADAFKALRQAIDALPPRAERKGWGPRVILPRATTEAQPAAPPDEEEEEEEE
jgi:hypothetical protein